MKIINVTDKCKQSDKQRDTVSIKRIVLHRFGWNTPHDWIRNGINPTGIGVGEFYDIMPYHFVITNDGDIHQTAKLLTVTPHAVIANPDSIGIAVLGDMRTATPTHPQWMALVDLCALLIRALDGLEIYGHTDIEGATNQIGKVCPGRALDIDELRNSANIMAHDLRWREFLNMGGEV